MNFMDATIVQDANGLWVDTGDFKLPLPADHKAKQKAGKAVTLGIRPEAIFDAAVNGPIAATDRNTVSGTVEVMEPLGHTYVAYLKLGSHSVQATLDSGTHVKEGDSAKFALNLDSLHIFDAETEQAIR
jgi:multiple sugar transport system ATP-binding protein